MKAILEEHCLSLVGTIERGLGYHLVQRKNGCFARRDSKAFVPPDGHWRFIVLCAEMAQNKLYITDIQVSREEVQKAVEEAGWCLSRFMENLHPTLTAKEVLTFKQKVGL